MKFWVSAFIWRKLWLRLIECSQVLTVRLLLVKERFFACKQLLQRQKRKGILLRIVTVDEEWVRYDNLKRRKSWGVFNMPPGRRPDRIFTVPGLCSAFGGASWVWSIMSCWNRVKPSQGNGIKWNWCVWAKHWRRNRHSAKRDTIKLCSSMTMVGHMSQDRSRHTWKRWNRRWRVLGYQHFRSYEEVKKWIDSWIVSKDASLFRDSIRNFPERWKKVMASDGQYFES